MADMNPVVWFEIPVEDMERAQAFYEGVLGVNLSLNEMDGITMAWFPMVQDATGAAGSLVKGEGYVPSQDGTMVYLNVADIEGALQKVEDRGGKSVQAKMSIGEYGFIGVFIDTEGNRVAFHSMS